MAFTESSAMLADLILFRYSRSTLLCGCGKYATKAKIHKLLIMSHLGDKMLS
jgi:hypothetical protein